jgi:methylase of polypeptide subunit release factors
MIGQIVVDGDMPRAAAGLGRAFDDANAADRAMAFLLKELRRRDYQFVTPTPATHAVVVGRSERREAKSLADVLGWSLPFRATMLDDELLALLQEAQALEYKEDGLWQSTVRVSSLHQHLFLHSAYPCDEQDAVFFGPDSYRFADAIVAELTERPTADEPYIIDIGTGSGVGAIVAAGACPDAVITMTDINAEAIRFARINAAVAGVPVRGLVSPNLSEIRGQSDLILANPPYMVDPARRAYRDGGGMHGGGASLTMTEMALDRLRPGGRFLLYTGSAIVRGRDALHDTLKQLAEARNCTMRYREIDPDVFGEELANPYYSDVDRIAVVTAVFTAETR